MPRVVVADSKNVGFALLVGVSMLFFFAGPAACAYAHVTRTRAAGSQMAIPIRASLRALRARDGVRARDVAATRAYIQADYRLTSLARRHLAASQASIRALVKRTVGECPLAGEGSYVNHAANEVSEEIVGTIVATAYHPDVAAIHEFVGAVQHLRWSSRTLTRAVRAYMVKLQNLAVLAPADICGDVKAFAATGFSSEPEATVRFDKLYFAADVEAEEVPLRLLAPYEDVHRVELLRRVKKLEAPLAEAEAKAVSQWMQIMRGLGLSV
jgi:hypothetical protein